MDLHERFWSKVSPEPNSGCWLWTGALNNRGYGSLSASLHGFRGMAHRASYELHVGKIRDGLEIDHLCKVRCCVNPDHLEAVTRLTNVRRSSAGFYRRTESNNVNVRKTHCPQGHPYSGANLWVSKYGNRQCKACHRQRELFASRERRARRRLECHSGAN